MTTNHGPFFEFARERHSIYLKRRAGRPRPWTKDPILDHYRFTNVFRELDKTTVWFREHVREPMRADPLVVPATVVFRWFNTIEAGEVIFSQPMMSFGTDRLMETPFEYFARTGSGDMIQEAMKKKGPPYVTGSYIIKGKDGMPKLDGVVWCLERFWKDNWRGTGDWSADRHINDKIGEQQLELYWIWLKNQVQYLGPFMAYEIVTDLRHTEVLRRATDIMTWANPGPGAKRGLQRIYFGRIDQDAFTREKMILAMRDLLLWSRMKKYWPQKEGWPAWEMRDVEHTLCEFDKYERARLGEGRPRGVYR